MFTIKKALKSRIVLIFRAKIIKMKYWLKNQLLKKASSSSVSNLE